MTLHFKPAVMGLVMSPMIMWMLHSALTGQDTKSFGALIIFVVAHVAIAAVIMGGAVFAARLSPRMRAWIARLHRPNLHHFASMVVGMGLGAGLIHLISHGGIV